MGVEFGIVALICATVAWVALVAGITISDWAKAKYGSKDKD